MEFMPWVAGIVVFSVLAAAAALIFHRPAATDMQLVQQIASAFNGAGSDVLKATVMPGFVSFVRQDKETHETARLAIQAGRSGRFNSTICTGVAIDHPAAAVAPQAGGGTVPTGGITISPVFNNYGGGPVPPRQQPAEPMVEVPPQLVPAPPPRDANGGGD